MIDESKAIQLMVKTGNAKSEAMNAVALAKNGRISEAREKLTESQQGMLEAHKVQTDILQASSKEGETSVSMMMAHAQDHMMIAMIAYDFASEIVDLYELIFSNIKKAEGSM